MALSESHLREIRGLVGEAHVGSDSVVKPGSPQEVAAVLDYANREGLRVGADFRLSLRRLNRIEEYNAADLTAGVEAGVTLAELDAALRANKQWLPLGAPRPDRTTIGAALATNSSGPFRLFYGTARDMVIGIRLVTAEGKLVKSGGRVVKNVAGYDLAKLIIGSRGTLAVITGANFKVFPRPVATETMAMSFATLAQSLEARTAIQKSALAPLTMDLLNDVAARVVSPQELPPGAWVLAVAYGGVEKVIERYRRDLEQMGRRAEMQASATLSGEPVSRDAERLWSAISDLPAHMEENAPRALRLKVTSTITQVGASVEAVLASAKSKDEIAVVSRAGTGVTYFYAEAPDPAAFVEAARRTLAPQTATGSSAGIPAGHPDSRAEHWPAGMPALQVEYSPVPLDPITRWGPPGDEFAVMKKLKQVLDPNGILNPGTFVGGI